MEQRLSLITLGVADVAASRRFYERLGWVASSASNDRIAFFSLGPVGLSLYQRDALAADAGVAPAPPPAGAPVTLAHNVASRDAVGPCLAAAVAAGATLVKPAGDADWGGYHGYFADPDGHLWEVAWNPFVALDPDGGFRLP